MKSKKEIINEFSNQEYCLFNVVRQIRTKGKVIFTNKHDYKHYVEVMKNVQMLIDSYPEHKEYWIKKYGSIFKAKKEMSLGCFYHDLMRGKSSTQDHGKHLFQLWKENKLPSFLPKINFKIAQAIRRHSFSLPKDCTTEDIFLKTADSLDISRYGYEINKALLPLKDCQERFKVLNNFKFIDFIPKLSDEEFKKIDERFSKKINKEIKNNFLEEKDKLGDPLIPKVEDQELETLLERLRERLNQQTFEQYRAENLKLFVKIRDPKHDLENCPALKLFIEYGKAFREFFSFQDVFDYDLKYLYEIKDYLPKKILARHLLYFYLTSSHPTLSIGSVKLGELFESVKEELKGLMRSYEKEQYDKLPKQIKVYRGFGEIIGEGIVPEIAFGVSWVDKIDIARGFAYHKRIGSKEWLKGYVLEGIVNKEDILFLRVPSKSAFPEHYELFINPLTIKGLKVIEVFDPQLKALEVENKFINHKENHIKAVNHFINTWENKNKEVNKNG